MTKTSTTVTPGRSHQGELVSNERKRKADEDVINSHHHHQENNKNQDGVVVQ
jgi:hypothetical protein